MSQRQDKTSWSNYGGVQTADVAAREAQRIQVELEALAQSLEFPLEILPVTLVADPTQLAAAGAITYNVRVVFAAGGFWRYELAKDGPPLIVFVRHRTEPHYLWYEIAHWRLLRAHGDEMSLPQMTVEDVVVDDPQELAWRLRAL